MSGDKLNYFIVGVDPGTTVAYAVFNLNGKLIGAGSRREMSREELTEKISSFGTPSVIACDVTPAPNLVLKLASSFNSKTFLPEKDLSEEEKRGITKGMKFENEHERDAAAAAIKAFNFFENKLRQIEKMLLERKLTAHVDEIKHLVLNNVSLQHALLMVEKGELKIENKKREFGKDDFKRKEEEIKRLLNSNYELKKSLEKLKNEKKLLEMKIEKLESKTYEKVLRESEIRKREIEILRLKGILNKDKQKEMPDYKETEQTVNLENVVDEYRKKRKDL
jgi:hypothetical protein